MSDSVTIHVRMRPELKRKIADAAARLEVAEIDAIRLCLAIGLADLKRINYDIPSAIVEKARRSAPKTERKKR